MWHILIFSTEWLISYFQKQWNFQNIIFLGRKVIYRLPPNLVRTNYSESIHVWVVLMVIKMTERQAPKYHRYLLSVVIICLMTALPRRDIPHLLTSTTRQVSNTKSIPKPDTCYMIFTLSRGFAIKEHGRDGTSHARPHTPSITPGEYLALGHALRSHIQKKSNDNTNGGKESNTTEADPNPLMSENPLILCPLRSHSEVTLNRCFSKRLEEKPTLQIFFMGSPR